MCFAGMLKWRAGPSRVSLQHALWIRLKVSRTSRVLTMSGVLTPLLPKMMSLFSDAVGTRRMPAASRALRVKRSRRRSQKFRHRTTPWPRNVSQKRGQHLQLQRLQPLPRDPQGKLALSLFQIKTNRAQAQRSSQPPRNEGPVPSHTRHHPR